MVASAVSEEYVAGAVQYDEESRARLCDSGLPDPDICDVLCAPPRDTEVVREAWSRGCARWFLVPRLSCPPSQYREKLRHCVSAESAASWLSEKYLSVRACQALSTSTNSIGTSEAHPWHPCQRASQPGCPGQRQSCLEH